MKTRQTTQQGKSSVFRQFSKLVASVAFALGLTGVCVAQQPGNGYTIGNPVVGSDGRLNPGNPATHEGNGRFGSTRVRRNGTTYAHQGVDITAAEGALVNAPLGGLVVNVTGNIPGQGSSVTLLHADGYTSHYWHLGDVRVRRGQWVDDGTSIGVAGRTGNVPSGATTHVHFGVRTPPAPGQTYGDWVEPRLVNGLFNYLRTSEPQPWSQGPSQQPAPATSPAPSPTPAAAQQPGLLDRIGNAVGDAANWVADQIIPSAEASTNFHAPQQAANSNESGESDVAAQPESAPQNDGSQTDGYTVFDEQAPELGAFGQPVESHRPQADDTSSDLEAPQTPIHAPHELTPSHQFDGAPVDQGSSTPSVTVPQGPIDGIDPANPTVLPGVPRPENVPVPSSPAGPSSTAPTQPSADDFSTQLQEQMGRFQSEGLPVESTPQRPSAAVPASGTPAQGGTIGFNEEAPRQDQVPPAAYNVPQYGSSRPRPNSSGNASDQPSADSVFGSSNGYDENGNYAAGRRPNRVYNDAGSQSIGASGYYRPGQRRPNRVYNDAGSQPIGASGYYWPNNGRTRPNAASNARNRYQRMQAWSSGQIAAQQGGNWSSGGYNEPSSEPLPQQSSEYSPMQSSRFDDGPARPSTGWGYDGARIDYNESAPRLNNGGRTDAPRIDTPYTVFDGGAAASRPSTPSVTPIQPGASVDSAGATFTPSVPSVRPLPAGATTDSAALHFVP